MVNASSRIVACHTEPQQSGRHSALELPIRPFQEKRLTTEKKRRTKYECSVAVLQTMQTKNNRPKIMKKKQKSKEYGLVCRLPRGSVTKRGSFPCCHVIKNCYLEDNEEKYDFWKWLYFYKIQLQEPQLGGYQLFVILRGVLIILYYRVLL